MVLKISGFLTLILSCAPTI